MTNLIGKTTINPFTFYSGKIAGYITWILIILLMSGVPIIEKKSNTYSDFMSYGLFAVGLILTVISLFNLGSSTRLGLPEEDTELKTGGLYRLSRNPMYVGFNLMTLASMFYSLNIIVIFLGVYSIIIYHFIIKREEAFLEKRFEDEYLLYKQKVRRYL